MKESDFYKKKIMAANYFFNKGFGNPEAVVLAKYWMVLWKLKLFLTPDSFYQK